MPLEDDHLSDTQLLRYRDEALSATARGQVEAHLDVCRDHVCRDRLDELDRNSLQAHGVSAAGVTPVPPDLRECGYTYEVELSGAVRTPPGVPARHEVYLARRTRDSFPVVVKFLRIASASSDAPQGVSEARLRFIQEAAATQQLRHPGIVPVLDFQSVRGRFFYVMEYIGPSLSQCQGGVPLWARLERAEGDAPADPPTEPYTISEAPTPAKADGAAPTPPRSAPRPAAPTAPPRHAGAMHALARWVVSLARTLQEVNKSGILHRDLKPGNILVREGRTRQPERLLITDFGILHHLNLRATAVEDGAVGTPQYLAPEQLDNRRELSPATDVYGLGGVLYYMLTAQHPLQLTSGCDWQECVRTKMPTPPHEVEIGVPHELEAICLKALEKEPRRRYQSAAELAEDLERYLAGKTPRAVRYPWWQRSLDWARNSPVPAAVIAVLTLLLAAVVALYVSSEEQRRRAETSEAREKQERGRAEKGEAEARRQLHDNLRQAARFALARGQRAEALVVYDQLLPQLPPPERLECRVERLPCLFLRTQWPRLETELKELAAGALPPTLRAQVLLHRGDVALWTPGLKPQAEARTLLTEALAIPDGLVHADAEYARGLLADGTTPALRHLEQAVRHDPFHPRARVALLFELLFSGQFQATERQLALAEAVVPAEPQVPAAGVLLSVLQGRARDGAPYLARLRRMLPRDQAERFAKLIAHMDRAFRDNREMGAPLGFAILVFDRNQLNVQPMAPLIGVASPTVGRLERLYRALEDVYRRLGEGDYRGAIAQCETQNPKYPEAWLRLAHSVAHLSLGMQYQRASNWEAMMDESTLAYKLAEEALRAPTVVPTAEIHHDAAWVCVAIQAGRVGERRRLAALLTGASVPRPDLASASFFAPLAALQLHLAALRKVPAHYDRSHVFRVAADSHGPDRARSMLLPKLLEHLPVDDGRLLLSDWEADEPKALPPLRLRAQFEFRQRNWTQAREYIDRVLRREPDDEEMGKLRDRLPR